MMKKTYQHTQADVISVAMTEMIALSQVENGQDLSGAPTTDATSGNLSRRRDVWEDEELEMEDDF